MKQENDKYPKRMKLVLKGNEAPPLDSACKEIVSRLKNEGYQVLGPVHIPTKILCVLSTP